MHLKFLIIQINGCNLYNYIGNLDCFPICCGCFNGIIPLPAIPLLLVLIVVSRSSSTQKERIEAINLYILRYDFKFTFCRLMQPFVEQLYRYPILWGYFIKRKWPNISVTKMMYKVSIHVVKILVAQEHDPVLWVGRTWVWIP